MFAKSLATTTPQSQAIHAINKRWGEGQWCGRETIGIAVCKKKYAPFCFTLENGPDGKVVSVERVFGCRMHSDIRKEKIEQHGERKGWEPFGQWSMRKALELARQETERINAGATPCSTTNLQAATVDLPELLSSDEELRSICHNGKCAWKIKSKYDNVHRELTGYSSSDED